MAHGERYRGCKYDSVHRGEHGNFCPRILVRGTFSAGPKGGSKVLAGVPSPYVELSVLFGAWEHKTTVEGV